MSAPDRPSREQVDAALDRVSEADSSTDNIILAAEVRALRAELDEVHEFGLTLGLRPALHVRLDVAAVLGYARDLVARTPQPAEHAAIRYLLRRCDEEIENRPACDCAGPADFGGGVFGGHEPGCAAWEIATLSAGEVRDALDPEAPLPAVPDGEDGRTKPLTVQALTKVLTEACESEDSGVDDDPAAVATFLASWLDTADYWVSRPPSAVDLPSGEDVPARLDAAAAVLVDLDWTGAAEQLRHITFLLKQEDAADVRAAVAAALARPTEQK